MFSCRLKVNFSKSFFCQFWTVLQYVNLLLYKNINIHVDRAGAMETNITESTPIQSLKLVGSIKEESLFKMCRPCVLDCSAKKCCYQYHCNEPGQPLGTCVTTRLSCGCDEYCKPYMMDWWNNGGWQYILSVFCEKTFAMFEDGIKWMWRNLDVVSCNVFF
jgi:hypothetical protein